MQEFARFPAACGSPASFTSFFNDISNEMVINLLPLFLSSVSGIETAVIGLIEGLAESTASLLKVSSGWFSNKLQVQRWLAVGGYALSTPSKPVFYVASSWPAVVAARWADRVAKGIGTSPRDALLADSMSEVQRGLALAFHRAAGTGGAVLGLLVAHLVI